MSRRVLLVHPEYPVTFWSFKHVLRFVSKKAAFPPLGLLTVASLLPSSWDLKLVDLNVENMEDDDIIRADMVMISAMLIQKKSVDEVIKKCRRLNRDVRIVAGGPLFNSTPEVYEDQVDHLVLNEAETTLKPFLEDLQKGTPKKIYRSEEFPDLSQTPVPRWDLINTRKYVALMVQCSRGCPFDCEFCDITALFGRRPRVKAAQQFIRELQAIYDTGWRDRIFIVDDNFIGNKAKIKEILKNQIDWMNQHGHPFSFLTEASINLADDDELIELMVEAGFDTVFIGLETPNYDSLRECEKKQNCRTDMVEAIEKLQKSGLQVLGGYIIGFDNDDESIFSRQIKFIQDSGVVTAMVGLLNALPNTRLWNRLKQENRLLVNASGDNTDGSINFIPKMDMQKLVEGYRQVIKTVYNPPHIYRRICRFLERYQPRRKRKVRVYELKAFLKAVFFLGILGNGISQWYFWRTILKSMIYYRQSFAEAVTLMIYCYHFRKVARKT